METALKRSLMRNQEPFKAPQKTRQALLVNPAIATRHLAAPPEEEETDGKETDCIGRGRRPDFGFVPSGPPPAPLAPFANVSMMTLDGKGVFSDKISFNDNGQPVRRTQSGIYQVNEDCTGQLAVTLPTPPFQLDFDIVVSGFVQGTGHAGEFYAIGVTPGGVVTFTARRIR